MQLYVPRFSSKSFNYVYPASFNLPRNALINYAFHELLSIFDSNEIVDSFKRVENFKSGYIAKSMLM